MMWPLNEVFGEPQGLTFNMTDETVIEKDLRDYNNGFSEQTQTLLV